MLVFAIAAALAAAPSPNLACDQGCCQDCAPPDPGRETARMGVHSHELATVESLIPPKGPRLTAVVAKGEGFLGATEVYFGRAKAPAFKVLSDTVLSVTVPAGVPNGEVPVRVRNGTGTGFCPMNIEVTGLPPQP